jgi:hypothetical protein
MIRINLLPHREEKRRERRQQFYARIGLITVLSGLIVFLVYSVIASHISAQDARNEFLRKEIAVLDKQIDQIKRLKEQSHALMERKRIIESLQRDRADAGGGVHPLAQAGRAKDQPGRFCSVKRSSVDVDAQHRSIALAGKTATDRNQGRGRRQTSPQ